MVYRRSSLEISISHSRYSLHIHIVNAARISGFMFWRLTVTEPAMSISSSRFVHASRTMCQASSNPDSRSVISLQSRFRSFNGIAESETGSERPEDEECQRLGTNISYLTHSQQDRYRPLRTRLKSKGYSAYDLCDIEQTYNKRNGW